METRPAEQLDSPTTATRPVVLITGASGLIGSRLVPRLQPDYDVVGLDLLEPPEDLPGLDWIKTDMTERESIEAALAEVRDRHGSELASVIHLAAYYDFSGEPSPLYRDLTVEGTRRLLQTLQSFRVEQFVFSSTLLVQQSSDEGEPITALSPVESEWDYPQSKLAAEAVIRDEHHHIPVLILRMAGAYDEQGHSPPLTQHIKRIYEKQLESYFFPGDKTHGQSFIHLDDLTECLRAAIDRRSHLPPYEVLVIGEEDVMSYEELQNEIGQLVHGREWPTIRIPKPMAKAGAWVKEKMASSEEEKPFIRPWMVDLADQNYPVDLRRASEQLQWSPRHTLRSTLPAMIERLKEDPVRFYKTNKLPMPEEMPAT